MQELQLGIRHQQHNILAFYILKASALEQFHDVIIIYIDMAQ